MCKNFRQTLFLSFFWKRKSIKHLILVTLDNCWSRSSHWMLYLFYFEWHALDDIRLCKCIHFSYNMEPQFLRSFIKASSFSPPPINVQFCLHRTSIFAHAANTCRWDIQSYRLKIYFKIKQILFFVQCFDDGSWTILLRALIMPGIISIWCLRIL